MWGKTEIRSRRKDPAGGKWPSTIIMWAAWFTKKPKQAHLCTCRKGLTTDCTRMTLKWHRMPFLPTLFNLPGHHRTPVAPLSHADPSPHPGFVLETWKHWLLLYPHAGVGDNVSLQTEAKCDFHRIPKSWTRKDTYCTASAVGLMPTTFLWTAFYTAFHLDASLQHQPSSGWTLL